MTGSEILNIEYKFRDLGDEKITIREYLKRLLETLINEGEGFSGKRPFGNSGWEYDLAAALVVGGAIEGTYDDEDEYIECYDYKWSDVRNAMYEAIAVL